MELIPEAEVNQAQLGMEVLGKESPRRGRILHKKSLRSLTRKITIQSMIMVTVTKILVLFLPPRPMMSIARLTERGGKRDRKESLPSLSLECLWKVPLVLKAQLVSQDLLVPLVLLVQPEIQVNEVRQVDRVFQVLMDCQDPQGLSSCCLSDSVQEEMQDRRDPLFQHRKPRCKP